MVKFYLSKPCCPYAQLKGKKRSDGVTATWEQGSVPEAADPSAPAAHEALPSDSGLHLRAGNLGEEGSSPEGHGLCGSRYEGVLTGN